MIKFEYDADAEAIGTRPPVSYQVKGSPTMTEEEAQTVALLEIAWALRDIANKMGK